MGEFDWEARAFRFSQPSRLTRIDARELARETTSHYSIRILSCAKHSSAKIARNRPPRRFLTPICRSSRGTLPQSSAEIHDAAYPFTSPRRRNERGRVTCLSAGSAETFLSRFRDTCLKNKARLTRRFFRSILHRRKSETNVGTSVSLPFPLPSPFVSELHGKRGELRVKGKRCDNFLLVTSRPFEFREIPR